MPQLKLRAIKAKHGDSLLLFASGATVLIDGGPSGVYNQSLREQLLMLDRHDDEPPRIDLLMVSHIDADHIDGVLDLTAELIEAREGEEDPLVRIDRAWHNSFSDLIAEAGVETSTQVSAAAANVAGVFEDTLTVQIDPRESKLVLSSVAQGRRLRLDLKALNIDLNQRFEGRTVLCSDASTPWSKGNLSMTVIGPTKKELDSLKRTWKKEVKKILASSPASTAAVGSLDKSVTNLASIVTVAEIGSTSVLLTGDARGDMIIEWLEANGRLHAGDSVHFSVLKLPHHGSDRNVSPTFFERVTADHYVICGNGGHGNPEPKTLNMLFEARPDLNYQVHMTYSPEELNNHKTYVKEGNVEKLADVLSDPKRKKALNFPEHGNSYLDIDL